jgi:predicted ribosome quality control (RQC) complex YloA/Tae2 family protein
MFDNYFFLKRIVKEIDKELKGFKFFKAISQSKNELVTGFFSDDKEKFLIFTFQKLPPFIYLREKFQFAKKNFAEFFEQLSDQIVKEITIDDFERNISFNFEDLSLVFLFRGHHSNTILIENNSKLILDSFKKSNDLINKNFDEIFPKSSIDTSIFKTEGKFNSLFNTENSQNKKYLKIIGNVLVEEIRFRTSHSDKSHFQIFNDLIFEINNSPLLIYEDGTCSFCELKHRNQSFRISENLFRDLANSYFTFQNDEDLNSLKEKLLKKLKSNYEHHFKKLQELKKPDNFVDHSEEFRQKGNLILIYANEIKKGMKSFHTEFENKRYTIKLDSNLSPFQNAELYFEKAKEEKSRIEALKKLIVKTEKELETTKDQIDEIENSTDIKELKKFMNEQKTQQEKDSIEKHFRHFKIEGKYDVYVGKDSKSNDLLTTQFAKSDDLWFHARGVSGSHVIIRRPNKNEVIPKNIIQQVASISAYYSKAKHSKLVPVSYTEKKYVIKRKGMPPGTVQLQREKVIMVEPKVPISEDNDEE